MKEKDKLKRLKHLMYTIQFPYSFDYAIAEMRKQPFVCKHTKEEIIEDINNRLTIYVRQKYPNDLIQREKDKLEIYKLAEELNIDVFEMWYEQNALAKSNKALYEMKPVRERKDNKDVLNLSRHPGGNGRNSIRYPKKNRKTAWKRFYKLFPKLDPKNKKDA